MTDQLHNKEELIASLNIHEYEDFFAMIMTMINCETITFTFTKDTVKIHSFDTNRTVGHLFKCDFISYICNRDMYVVSCDISHFRSALKKFIINKPLRIDVYIDKFSLTQNFDENEHTIKFPTRYVDVLDFPKEITCKVYVRINTEKLWYALSKMQFLSNTCVKITTSPDTTSNNTIIIDGSSNKLIFKSELHLNDHRLIETKIIKYTVACDRISINVDEHMANSNTLINNVHDGRILMDVLNIFKPLNEDIELFLNETCITFRIYVQNGVMYYMQNTCATLYDNE